MSTKKSIDAFFVMAKATRWFRLSDKPIAREVSQDRNILVSYAADGAVVETVILEAARIGAGPLQIEYRQAA